MTFARRTARGIRESLHDWKEHDDMKEAPPPLGVTKADPVHPEPGYRPTQAAAGCLCPPGANLTCENPDCPRKPSTTAKAGSGDLMMKGGTGG
jgi:hypothetical protein